MFGNYRTHIEQTGNKVLHEVEKEEEKEANFFCRDLKKT